jgi:predicted DNA binding CopG/RHH family protein
MSSPKKKLPTGPIRIDAPVAKRVALPEEDGASSLHPTETESSRQILEKGKQDSELPETSNQESGRAENSNQQATRGRGATQQEPELKVEEYRREDSSISPRITESGIPDSGVSFPEYKKVAMRLSVEAVESLRQLRATTGVPYEILVDVMIRNWDNLPKRTQAAYLQQAKQARVERLIAGQEKTVKTMRAKYLEQ